MLKEYVKNLPLFLRQCNSLLKEQGNFYASFGPVWYGQGGDHLYWGLEGIFNYLLLDKNEYIDILKGADFLLGKLWMKSSSIAWKYFRLYPGKEARVELRGNNGFDRYCRGMYLWAMKKKSNSV